MELIISDPFQQKKLMDISIDDPFSPHFTTSQSGYLGPQADLPANDMFEFLSPVVDDLFSGDEVESDSSGTMLDSDGDTSCLDFSDNSPPPVHAPVHALRVSSKPPSISPESVQSLRVATYNPALMSESLPGFSQASAHVKPLSYPSATLSTGIISPCAVPGPALPPLNSSGSMLIDQKFPVLGQQRFAAVQPVPRQLSILQPPINRAVDLRAHGHDPTASALVKADKRTTRLARKAELARASRKRKNLKMMTLESHIAGFKEELGRARKQRKLDLELIAELRVAPPPPAPPQRPACNESVTQIPLESITTAIARNDADSKDDVCLENLVNTFAQSLNGVTDVSKKRLEELNTVAAVPLPLQFLEWAMGHEAKFFEKKGGLWSGAFGEIGYTKAQMADLMNLRDQMMSQRELHRQAEEKAKAYRESLRQLHSKTVENFGAVRGVLTDLQVAKFFDWCETQKDILQMVTVV